MGFWNSLYSFWVLLYSTTDKLKENAPDMTAVTNAYRSSYDHGYAAVTKIDNAVRVDGAQKVNEYLPDPQAREMIGRIATSVAKYGAEAVVRESLKGVTGGVQIYEIVRDGLMDQPPFDHGSEKSKYFKEMMEEMQKKMDKMQEEINNSKEMMEEMEKKMDKMREEVNNINYHNKILLERIKQYESPNEISTRSQYKSPKMLKAVYDEGIQGW